MRIRFDSVGTQLISGSMLGVVLGAQLYVMQSQPAEPSTVYADTNECYMAIGPGMSCPSGWIPVGSTGCYADGTTTCSCTGGGSGLCGAGACICLPCDLNTGGPCSASAVSVSTTPCGPGQTWCQNTVSGGGTCCDDALACDPNTGACIGGPSSADTSSANPPSSGSASSPC
jgi:hypothetical protein